MTGILPLAAGDCTSTDGVASPEDLSTASWTGFQASAPAADTIRTTAVNSQHYMTQTLANVAGQRIDGAMFEASPDGYDYALLWLYHATGNQAYAYVNLATGAVGNVLNCTCVSAPAATGYTFVLNITAGITFSASQVLRVAVCDALNNASFAGDITKGIKVYQTNILYNVATLALPSLPYFGMLNFTLSGEKAGDPTQTFSWECEALYSCDAGVATMRSQGVPVVLDPDGYAWEVVLDGTGANARIRVVGQDGENWVWAARISNSGRTRLPTGTTSYVDAAVHASVTADFVYTGANVCTDPNCENVALWAAGGGAALTNEAGGVAGNCMRVTRAGAGGSASQATIGANQRYNATGWGRCDAGAQLALTFGGPHTPYASPAVWTEYPMENLFATATNLSASKTSVGGTYAEFDSISAIRLPIASAVADQILGGPGVAQAVAANRPTYIDAGDYFLFDGSSQWFVGQVPNQAAGTLAAWVYLPSVVAQQQLFGSRDASLNYTGVGVQAGVLYGYLGANPANRLAHGTAFTAGAWHHVAITWVGAVGALYLDGVALGGVAGVQSTLATWWGCRNAEGVLYSGAVGNENGFLQAIRAFSAAEILDLYNGTYRT